MAQKKGHTGNPNGRPKGSKNVVHSRTKELISKFAEDNIDDVMKAFKRLDDKDKVSSFIGLLKYVIPPARDVEGDEDKKEFASELMERIFNRK